LYGVKIWTVFSAVLSQFKRLTDGRTEDRQTSKRTDRIFIARPRLHSMQRGNKMLHRNCSNSDDARGVAEYSDFGPIERYISKTVQDKS